MKLSGYEQESILNYNAGEQTATLYTRDKAVMWKLDTYACQRRGGYSCEIQRVVFAE